MRSLKQEDRLRIEGIEIEIEGYEVDGKGARRQIRSLQDKQKKQKKTHFTRRKILKLHKIKKKSFLTVE